MNYLNRSTSAIRLGQVTILEREMYGFERLARDTYMNPVSTQRPGRMLSFDPPCSWSKSRPCANARASAPLDPAVKTRPWKRCGAGAGPGRNSGPRDRPVNYMSQILAARKAST